MEEDGFDVGDEIDGEPWGAELEGGPLGSDDDEDDEDEITWHEIATTAGAYCIVCRRGIRIGEDAWWNHESRDVACSNDGESLYREELMKNRMKKAVEFFF